MWPSLLLDETVFMTTPYDNPLCLDDSDNIVVVFTVILAS